MDTNPKPSRVHLRGFASMSPERRLEVARKGGAAVDPAKRSFAKDRTLAEEAGRKGGLAVRTKARATDGAA